MIWGTPVTKRKPEKMLEMIPLEDPDMSCQRQPQPTPMMAQICSDGMVHMVQSTSLADLPKGYSMVSH